MVDNSGDTPAEDGTLGGAPNADSTVGDSSATASSGGSPANGVSGETRVDASGGDTTTNGSSAKGGAPSTVGMPSGSGAQAAGSATGSGLPCDVHTFIAAKCQACHSVKPPGALFTASDFAAQSTLDPSKTIAQLALQRIQTTSASRMPPTGLAAATPEEIAAFKAWVDAGAPSTACGPAPTNGTDPANGATPAMDPPPNPYATPVMCSSGSTWRSGEGLTMRPGEACINCHSRDEGPVFSIAGTVYPTAHEPNDCNGADPSAAARVVITDKNGQEFTVQVNAAGNFSLRANIAFPFRAKVVAGGKERAMLTAQSSGDCNACHTQNGANNAPGRIMLP